VTTFPFDPEENDMTHDTGADLRPLLAAAVADAPPDTDLLSGVRRTRRRRALVPLASVTAAGALCGVAVLTVGGTPSAQATVTAAAERSAGTSFRVHLTSERGVGDGVFDPAHRLGRLTYPGGEHRYVGDTVYTRTTGPKAVPLPQGKHWVAEPRLDAADVAQMGPALEVIKLGPQDPAYVLGRLRSATHVRDAGTASGPGWTGHRYAFTLRGGGTVKGPVLTESGTVAVDSRGLVRVLDLAVRAGDGPGRPVHSVVEFGDYGVRVDVAAPPAREVIADKASRPDAAPRR
jgi:hypothetical protein